MKSVRRSRNVALLLFLLLSSFTAFAVAFQPPPHPQRDRRVRASYVRFLRSSSSSSSGGGSSSNCYSRLGLSRVSNQAEEKGTEDAEDDNQLPVVAQGITSPGDSDSVVGMEEAERWKQKAAQLREEIRRIEGQRVNTTNSSNTKKNNNNMPQNITITSPLHGKTVLVVGANGRLGSRVCRHLLRHYPHTHVVAAVHAIADSATSANPGSIIVRGYERLSFEVGAEDSNAGRRMNAAWRIPTSDDDDNNYNNDATMSYSNNNNNLQNLRVVECEVLDPVQCRTITNGIDAVLFCAADNNNMGISNWMNRAASQLFSFGNQKKTYQGRVAVEGVQNMFSALQQELQHRQRPNNLRPKQTNNDAIHNQHLQFVLVQARSSSSPAQLRDDDDNNDSLETPPSSFSSPLLLAGGEATTSSLVQSAVVQLAHCDDGWLLPEDMELRWRVMDDSYCSSSIETDKEEERLEVSESLSSSSSSSSPSYSTTVTTANGKIHRQDAARAVVEALVTPEWAGKILQVWTK